MSKLLAVETTTGLSDAGDKAGYVITRDLPALVGLLFNAVLGILGVVFLILVIYAGFSWMTAAGNSKSVDHAKSILIRATVGLVICASAFAISNFIIGALERSQSSSASDGACFDSSCGL